jgi:hypothetical protein
MTAQDDPTSSIIGDVIPSNPSPQLVTLVYDALRYLLAALGVILGMWGGQVPNVTTSNLMILAGAIAWFIVFGWSIWQKFHAAKMKDASAVASASKRSAVVPVHVGLVANLLR